jgi:hypothetical protein
MQNTTLPYLPESASEALSSTHLFTVEVVSVHAAPWAAQADGLEHRRLDLGVRLLENLKGDLAVPQGETFRVAVEQRRENEYMVSDYHGLWSHFEPQVGQILLIVAEAQTTSPAALMQEGICKRILDAEYASDIRVDLEAEHLFRESLTEANQDNPELTAVEALLKFTFERRATTRDLMARYMWDYVEPVFLREPDKVLPFILPLILAEDATVDLRMELVSDLYDAVLRLEADPDISRQVIVAFFSLLFQQSASRFYDSLVEVQLYNLIFRNDEPQFRVATLFPNPADRARLKTRLEQFDSDQAEELMDWLDS